MPFNETRLDRSTDKAQGKASMSSPAVAPETSPSQPLFEPPDGRIYPDEDKNPAQGNVGSKNGNGAKSGNPAFVYGTGSHLKRWQFTAETARPASILGNKAIAESKIQPKPAPNLFDPHTRSRLRLLKEQIAGMRKELNNKVIQCCPHCSKPVEMRLAARDRAQLLNALDRLLERERILRGIAAPAPFRAPRQTRQSSNNTAEPL
jgi:hypothetical protein